MGNGIVDEANNSSECLCIIKQAFACNTKPLLPPEPDAICHFLPVLDGKVLSNEINGLKLKSENVSYSYFYSGIKSFVKFISLWLLTR